MSDDTAQGMGEDHLERLEALLKRSPGILWEGLAASEVGDVRACLDELKQARAQLAEIGETRTTIQFRACQSPDGPLIDWTDLVVGQSMMIAPWPDSVGRIRLDFQQAQP